MKTESSTTEREFFANTVRLAAGASVLLIGLIVLIGWHTRNEMLIQFFPGFSIMQYNTALGLMLCGAGLFLAFRKRVLILTCGILVLLLGSATLGQYIFDVNFGIDQFFMWGPDVNAFYPERMPQNAALCFVLSGVALLLRRKNKTGYPLLLLKALLGAIITALAAVSLAGHLSGIPTGFGWDDFSGMATHTSAGFILVGGGLIALAWSEAKLEKIEAPHWLPTLVTVAALTATLCLWQVLYAQERLTIDQTVQTEANNLKTQFETEFNTRILALEQMANRWSLRPNGTPRSEWEADVRHYVKDYDSYQAIEWADSSFIIRWIEPEKGNEKALNLDLSRLEDRVQALEYARDNRVSVLTRKYPLTQGGSGIIIYTPIYQNEEFGGFIIGVFRAEELFKTILPREFAADYSLNLSDGDQTLFHHGETQTAGQMQWAKEVLVASHGTQWKAVVFPNRATLAKLHSPVDETALLGGLLMCILLVIAVHLAQAARQRAFESAGANRDLKKEIAERQRASEELQASEQHNRDIIERSLGFICTHTLDGIWLSINPAAAGSLGYEPAEMIGRNISEFIPAADLPLFKKYLAKIRRKCESSGSFNINTRSGQPRIWSFNNTLHEKTGEDAYILGHAIDVTERNRVEEELKKARNAALESARIKSEFLANMSHEIRTPMNGVLGMTELLAETHLTDRQLEYVSTIRKSGDSLLAIINDILDFSKIEAGKLRFEEIDFDLRSTVENTVDLFTEQAAAKNIELASLVYSNVEVALRGDPGRLRQILTNLIGNAVKFTESGEITVRVTRKKETRKNIVLCFNVHDTGIGINPEAQKNLFQAFTQADGSMTRKFGGTGLGLTISKQLVEMMEGRIHLDSEVGKGSVFTFTAKFAKQTEPKKKLVLRRDLTDLHTLIVDDNETNRKIIRHQIKSWGLVPAEARDGHTALKILRRAAAAGQPYNLVILDLTMPGMDGFELARLIKADPQTASARLILMPSFGRRGHGRIAQEINIDGYLIKPIKQADLFDCIAAVTARSAAAAANGSAAAGKPLITKHTINEHRYDKTEPILIVEDNIVNQRLIKLQLEKTGYRADVVTNGREALRVLEKKKYALILMDCQMPEMDGYAATREIRRNETAEHVPIIAITANVMPGEFEKCADAGMDDYLAKPFKQTELAGMIKKWVEGSEATPVGEKPPLSKHNGSEDDLRGAMAADVGTRLAGLTTDVGAEVVADVIELFIEDSAGRLKNLRRAVKEKDFAKTKLEAHGLKGSCGNIGANLIAGLCFQSENEAKAENLEGLRATLGKIEELFPVLIETLETGRRGEGEIGKQGDRETGRQGD